MSIQLHKTLLFPLKSLCGYCARAAWAEQNVSRRYCWRALRICGSFTIFKSIRTVDLPIGRPRYCRSMRKARESSMALVLWRFVLAVVLSFCAVAVIAPRQAPAADVIVFLD
jgi:hypothetical protein